jgi:hypothetical protein
MPSSCTAPAGTPTRSCTTQSSRPRGVRANAAPATTLHSSACHTLVYCLSKNDMNHVSKTIDLLSKMKMNDITSGCTPSMHLSPIFNFCETRKVDKAHKLFHAMMKIFILDGVIYFGFNCFG